MSHKHSQQIREIINNPSGQLAKLATRCDQLAACDQLVAKLIEYPLAAHISVASIEGNVLTLLADSPVWASKIRFQLPRLVQHLCRENLCTVQSARVITRPPAPLKPPSQLPPARLSATAGEFIAGVAATCHDPALKAALLRLSSRACLPGGSGNEPGNGPNR